MKDLFNRHYKAIVDRGLITPETDIWDFLEKADEEFIEIKNAENDDEFVQETIDTICVLTNMLQFMNIDIEYELLKNIETQEKRANEIHKNT